MPVFQYKCDKCSSVFEHLVSSGKAGNVACVSCGSKKIKRLYSSHFGIHLKNSECGGCKVKNDCYGSINSSSCGCPFKKFAT